MHDYDKMTEPQLREHFTQVSEMLTGALPEYTGFLLLATPFGPGQVTHYTSNVRREDAAEWMQETLARWQTGDHVDRTPPVPQSPTESIDRAVARLYLEAIAAVEAWPGELASDSDWKSRVERYVDKSIVYSRHRVREIMGGRRNPG